MKKHLRLMIAAGIALAAILIFNAFSIAKEDPKSKLMAKLRKPDVLADFEYIGFTNWNYVMRNNGSYMYDQPDRNKDNNNAGGEFPRGSKNTIVFAGGFQIGAIKGPNRDHVVSDVEFATEFQPGRIINSGVSFDKLKAQNPADPDAQVFTVTKNGYKDEGIGNSGFDDYANWPADANKNRFGAKGVPGNPALIADVNTWAVFNDLDLSIVQDIAQSPNSGLGLQVILESYAFSAGVLSDVVFLKFTIENKTNENYDSSYIGLWMDGDVTNLASNDIVGCDSLRGLGYTYNADNVDAGYAVGFDFFSGPVVDISSVSANLLAKFGSNKTVLRYDQVSERYISSTLPGSQMRLGATGFYTYAGGTDPSNNLQRYNRLSGKTNGGLARNGTGVNHYYAFPGDPLGPNAATDPNVASFRDQSDVRMAHTVGPFTIKAGESQEIWAGVVGGQGADRLDAVRNMFRADDFAQRVFEGGINSAKPPVPPVFTVTPGDSGVFIQWQNNAEVTNDDAGTLLGIDKAHGYSADYVARDFQGYRVYKSRTGLPGTYSQLAQYDKADGITSVINQFINSTGNLEIKQIFVGTDNGLVYYYEDKNVTKGQVYYYSVTAYDAQPYISGPGTLTLPGTVYGVKAEAELVRLTDVSGILPMGETLYTDLPTIKADPTYVVGNPLTHISDAILHTPINQFPRPSARAYAVQWYGKDTTSYSYEALKPAFGYAAKPEVGNKFKFSATLDYDDRSITANLFNLTVIEVLTFENTIPAPSGLPITLESEQTANVQSVVPGHISMTRGSDAGILGDTVRHTGNSDGRVLVSMIDPNKITGHTYRVEFFNIPSSVDGKAMVGYASGTTAYQIVDSNTGAILNIPTRADDPLTFLDADSNGIYNVSAGDRPYDDSKFAVKQGSEFIVVDGIRIEVYGAIPDVKDFQITSNASGPAAWPANYGSFSFNSSGFPNPRSESISNGYDVPWPNTLGHQWGIQVASGDMTVAVGTAGVAGSGAGFTYTNFVTRCFRDKANFPRFVPYDFELRFTAAGGKANWAFTTGNQGNVPFEIWNVGFNTPNDPSDDYRMYPRVNDAFSTDATETADVWELCRADHPISGGADDPFTDWIYWMNPANTAPGQAGYNAAVAANGNNGLGGEVMARTVLVALNLRPGGNTAGATNTTTVWNSTFGNIMPETGQTFRIISTKPAQPGEYYSFTTKANAVLSKRTQKKNIDNILVVPNPYYGPSTYQANLSDKQIKFMNLPDVCTIKIFTVAGDVVKILPHNAVSKNGRVNSDPLSDKTATPSTTTFETWNVRNDNNHYVASGMYIALIETPGLGKKVVKFAVIQDGR